MEWLRTHLRDKFLAGILAAVPIVIVVYSAVWVETNTKPLAEVLGISFPGLGVLIVVAGIYLLGLIVTSFFGRFFLSLGDRVLSSIPGFNLVYRAWKDVLVVSPDKTGMFHCVVLVQTGQGAQVGFTSLRPLPTDPDSIAVFVPNVPTPISGRLIVARRDACLLLNISVEDAVKFLVSTGNYLPPGLRGLASVATRPDEPVASSGA